MATKGGEMAGQILYLGGEVEPFLDRVLADLTGDSEVDHLVGIATTSPVARWIESLERVENRPKSGTLLDLTGESREGTTPPAPSGFDVRDRSGASLGDVGTDVIDSFRRADPARPAVVIDSVAGLSEDPGKQFKFLTLLGKRLSKDDGVFRAFEGPEGLEEFEVATLAEVFDDVQDADW